MINILVTGHKGQLGNEIRSIAGNYPDYDFLFTDLEELDITNSEAVEFLIKQNSISCIINVAGYTAVDKAESEPEFADLVNGTAVGILAEAAAKYNALFIHISTDYVFDGKGYRPLVETDKPAPISAYAKSKYLGEKLILQNANKAVILRTSWLYSSFGHNFVKSMLKYGKERDVLNIVFDQIGTPTYAADLAKVILDLIPTWLNLKKIEIYHFSNEGVCSWYDFTKAILEIAGIDCKVNPIETKDYPLPAERPFYSIMSKEKIKKEFDIEIPYWKDSLKICLDKL